MKKAFKHLATAINWVEHVNKFRPKQNLQRISKAWEILNLDLSTITKIQVIGTNGKGSTTHFISNIYKINNYKVGTFTSPYLVSFNERIQINGQEIDDKTLLNLLNFIYDFNNNFTESFGESLIFFEMLTLMALKYFVDEKCHIIVMEAGIGGLLDSTSVLKYDAVCLTNVGLDHQKILGLSKEEILINKLGALKPQGLLLTTEISLKKLIKSEAQRVNFKVIFVNDKVEVISYFPLVINYFNEIIRSPLLGEYQIKNIALSIRCALTLHPNFLISSCKEAIEGVNFPGRLEYLNKHTIIDGAHNISAIECVVEAL
ncbi:MAG: hypothetical protein LBV55_03675, partial [Acholeplasmatales bacterium]|nr:hypothetical protein [Acholeplasmatales bacterium]